MHQITSRNNQHSLATTDTASGPGSGRAHVRGGGARKGGGALHPAAVGGGHAAAALQLQLLLHDAHCCNSLSPFKRSRERHATELSVGVNGAWPACATLSTTHQVKQAVELFATGCSTVRIVLAYQPLQFPLLEGGTPGHLQDQRSILAKHKLVHSRLFR